MSTAVTLAAYFLLLPLWRLEKPLALDKLPKLLLPLTTPDVSIPEFGAPGLSSISELILNDYEQKDNIKTFLMDFNIEETLYREFVIETNMDVSEFYETYEKSLEDYFGKLY